MIQRVVRNRLIWLVSIPATVIILYLAFAFFGVQALFFDREVNEEFVAGAGATEQRSGSTIEDTAMGDLSRRKL